MRRITSLAVGFALVAAVAACSIFENPSPEQISVSVTGSAGTVVTAIYSQLFVAGINQETNVTEVKVTASDTVIQVLPLDTIVDIRASRQLFLQVETSPTDTAEVRLRVEVDGRGVVDRMGAIWDGSPLRYVYQFNRPLTNVVEVVF